MIPKNKIGLKLTVPDDSSPLIFPCHSILDCPQHSIITPHKPHDLLEPKILLSQKMMRNYDLLIFGVNAAHQYSSITQSFYQQFVTESLQLRVFTLQVTFYTVSLMLSRDFT